MCGCGRCGLTFRVVQLGLALGFLCLHRQRDSSTWEPILESSALTTLFEPHDEAGRPGTGVARAQLGGKGSFMLLSSSTGINEKVDKKDSENEKSLGGLRRSEDETEKSEVLE